MKRKQKKTPKKLGCPAPSRPVTWFGLSPTGAEGEIQPSATRIVQSAFWQPCHLSVGASWLCSLKQGAASAAWLGATSPPPPSQAVGAVHSGKWCPSSVPLYNIPVSQADYYSKNQAKQKTNVYFRYLLQRRKSCRKLISHVAVAFQVLFNMS